MFMIFNKWKIYSYIVALSTVVVLFAISTVLFNNPELDVLQASAGVTKELPVYCVKTEDNKIALTMNCAWNADDIDKILEILKEQNVKLTFFMVGDWVDKYPDAVKKISDAGHEIANHSDRT